ncbi:MAG: hypothetical protein CYPHOPRED_005152 [Cyphobasidiales sp. Tagirdzhanova-0007]|nr:MAG: hypothetical protein CYPHOPRED_005152 [Cyphobasidiales sp. Tagirdzhanova-0007]
MTKSSGDKYTDPELRDHIKEEIQDGDKGGQPGQWSARKGTPQAVFAMVDGSYSSNCIYPTQTAQMMASEYKKQGGGYTTDKKDEKAQHLDQWTKEEWQTKDGDANASTEEGTHRYLPKKAWEHMDEKEKAATDVKKLKGSKIGEQYVPNTEKAKRARKDVSAEPEDEKKSHEEPQTKKAKSDKAEEADMKAGANSVTARETESEQETDVNEDEQEPEFENDEGEEADNYEAAEDQDTDFEDPDGDEDFVPEE